MPQRPSIRSSRRPAHARFTLAHRLPPRTPRPDLRWVSGKLAEVAALLPLAGSKLSVVVIDDAKMAAMHEQFTGVTGTTDVLTFDLCDHAPPTRDRSGNPAPPAGPLDGEIYLCLDEARRRAEQFGHTVEAELLLYAVHGTLHLLGYDDHRPADHRRMHAEEDRLLEAVGVGAVYRPQGRPRQ